MNAAIFTGGLGILGLLCIYSIYNYIRWLEQTKSSLKEHFEDTKDELKEYKDALAVAESRRKHLEEYISEDAGTLDAKELSLIIEELKELTVTEVSLRNILRLYSKSPELRVRGILQEV